MTSRTNESSKRTNTVSVLDIGSSKVCCMIARTKRREGEGELKLRTQEIEVLGVGYQRSSGVKAGAIVDVNAAERTIRQVVSTAEAAAGVTVGSMIVNASAPDLRSRLHTASVTVRGNEVEDGDIGHVLRSAVRNSRESGRTIVHSLPTSYCVDGADEVDDPRGLVGRKLAVNCHVASLPDLPLENIERVVNRAHLEVEAFVAAPYAAALSSIIDDEADMGCLTIDMGAGTTSFALMTRGRFLHGDAVAVGGQHVTTDLARGLSTTIEQAERLKVMEASVAAGPYGDEPIALQPFSMDGSAVPATVPRALVGQIVRARLEETFEMVRDRVRASGLGSFADRRVVLTGGASQLTGISDVARRMLAKNVRVARPIGIRGLAPMQKTPPFSTAVGLMVYPQFSSFEFKVGDAVFGRVGGGRIGRIREWFRGF